MADTEHFEIPKPRETDNIDAEMRRLQAAWDIVDGILNTFLQAINGKAPTNHSHGMDQVTGLSGALAGKMASNKTFSLAELTDVVGYTDAPQGYVPVKNADGKVAFLSAAAAIGNHQHNTTDIVGLTELIQSAVDSIVDGAPPDLNTLLEIANALSKRLRFDAAQVLTPTQRGQAVANLDLAAITGDRNLLINGELVFISYGSKTIPAGGADWVFDRWLIGNETNQPLTVSQILAPLGSFTSIPGNPIAKMRLAFAIAPTSGVVRIVQRIENVHNLADRVASARAYFKGPAGSEALSCNLLQNFGTGGSPSSPVTIASASQDINTINDAVTEQRRAQFVVPPLTGKTLGTNGGHFLALSWVLTPRQAGVYEAARFSLVAGDAFAENDPFTNRLMGTQRALCLRYAETIIFGLRWNANSGGAIQNITVGWYPKRTIPGVTFIGLGAGANISAYGWSDIPIENMGRFEAVSAGGGDTYMFQATYRIHSEL